MKVKSFFFAIGVLLLLWVIFPLVFVALNNWLDLPVYIFGMFRLIGLALIVLGLTMSLVASRTFVQFSDGTPAITEPPKKLVIKGLYKLTRNPIYVSHVLISLGLFISFGYVLLFVYSVIAALGLHLYLIKIEEPLLIKRHCKDYLNYMKQVRRWI